MNSNFFAGRRAALPHFDFKKIFRADNATILHNQAIAMEMMKFSVS
jgi:hypothetical protein